MNVKPVFIPRSHVAEWGVDMPGQGLLLYHTAPSLCLDKVRVRLAVPTAKRNQSQKGGWYSPTTAHLYYCCSGFCLQRAVLSTHQVSDPPGP